MNTLNTQCIGHLTSSQKQTIADTAFIHARCHKSKAKTNKKKSTSETLTHALSTAWNHAKINEYSN